MQKEKVDPLTLQDQNDGNLPKENTESTPKNMATTIGQFIKFVQWFNSEIGKKYKKMNFYLLHIRIVTIDIC